MHPTFTRCRRFLSVLAIATLCLANQARAQTDAKPRNPASREGTRTYVRPPDLENVSYGPHPRNVLDLWKANSEKPTPLVVYFHPGGFTLGDKRGENTGLPQVLLNICLARGISVATANYRYSWQAPFPAQLEDGARFIQFLRHHAKEWNLHPAAIATTGASAGADISMWLGFKDDMADPASPDPILHESTRVPVIGALDGQSSLDPLFIQNLVGEEVIRQAGREALAPLFGLPRDEDFIHAERAFPLYEAASAINFVKAGVAPAFLFYSHPPGPLPPATKAEGIHNYRFGVALKERMDKAGVECVLHHSGEYPQQNRPAQMNGEMVEFFLKHFPKG